MGRPDATVVICAFTLERWEDLAAAVRSVNEQDHAARSVVVVIDHNDELLARAQASLDARVCANQGARGLSDARNTGLQAADTEVVVFLDDDARAEPGWLHHLLTPYADDPSVVGVGGRAVPEWVAGRPAWFPEEFDWVVGCSYAGLPASTGPVRNLMGCNMSFRTDDLLAVDGFDPRLGRVGSLPAGCEETHVCIRLAQRRPGARFLYEPRATVRHRVGPQRGTWRYFTARCWREGQSKALLVGDVGQGDGLASERRYARRVLPVAAGRYLATGVSSDVRALGRAAAVVAGLGVTATGYASGWVHSHQAAGGRSGGALAGGA